MATPSPALRCKSTGVVAVLAMLATGPASPVLAATEPVVVVGARAGAADETTRFVLDLTGPVDFDVFVLDGPRRVVADLSEVRWALPSAERDLRAGLVLGFRHGLFRPGRSRLVLDVQAGAAVRDVFLLEPTAGFGYRLVIDLVAAGSRRTRPDLEPEPEPPPDEPQPEPPPDTPEPEPPPDEPEPEPPPDEPGPEAAARDGPPPPGDKPRRAVIVIDPGHGGEDPGAISARGAREKDLVLQASRQLKRQLEADGRHRVVLTRDSDVFLRLADRVAVARKHGADLFISVHADSIADPSVRGAGVYTLSETASDDEAAALAAAENKADLIAGVDLVSADYDELTTTILIDLAQRETMNASSRFAETLSARLSETVRLRGNAHRFAGFRVLKAPDIPSVLIEMGYLSNPEEERRLRDRSFRERFMAAVAAAIGDYLAAAAP